MWSYQSWLVLLMLKLFAVLITNFWKAASLEFVLIFLQKQEEILINVRPGEIVINSEKFQAFY